MSWWDSIDTVSRFNNWMMFAVIVFAFLTAVSGFLVWLSGNRISLQQAESAALVRQNIKTYEKTSLNVHKELVTLQQKQFETEQLLKVANTNLTKLRNQLKKAEKKRLGAEQALSRIKMDKNKTVPKYEIQVIPEQSALFSKFNARFLDILKQGPEGIIDIYAVKGDSTSIELAADFHTLFNKAGWTTNGVVQSTFFPKIEGLVLAFNSKDTAPSYASFLLQAFNRLGITVSSRTNNKYPEWSLSLIVSDFPASVSSAGQDPL